jgi:hypothetical protein
LLDIAPLLLLATALQPQTLFTIDVSHKLIEGVASDGRTIWVSSVVDRTVLACTWTCRAFARLPKGLHPLGITWDATRGRLWIAADCPQVDPIPRCERGALLALDRRGRLVTRAAPQIGRFHPGDVAAAPAGVFVSDSLGGAVYRLIGKSRLAEVVPAAPSRSAQGLAVSASGKQLLLADYSAGLFSIDLATGKANPLPGPGGKPLRGIDGLTRCGSTYYAVYNGSQPGYLVSIRLSDGGARVGRPLGTRTFADPTQVGYDGKRLLIVPQSGWSDPRGITGAKANAFRTERAPIISLPLGKDCRPR